MALEDLEFQTLSIIRDRFNYLRHAHILNDHLFESPGTRFIFNLIKQFHEKHDTSLTIRALRIMLTSKTKPEDAPKFRGMIRRIKRNQVTNRNLADDILKRFVQRQLIRQAAMKAIESLESGETGDLERVREKIDEAIQVEVQNVDESYDYFKDPLKRVEEEASESRLPTGIYELDQAMLGGLAAGEIGMVIAPTGFGKTITLVNFGYAALRQGRKVVHATLEISPRKVARRYDTRLTGLSFSELKKDPELLHKKLGLLARKGAKLQVKDYTSTTCSVGDIRAYLERLKAKGHGVDLLIVDYADLMYSTTKYTEKRHELSNIVSSLRRLGNEFKIPVWTASQAGRAAGKKGVTTLWDISEDIGKANWSDFALSISQNEEEKEEGIMYYKIEKSRLNRGNPRIKVFVNYDTLRITGAKKSVGELKRKLRDGP